MPAVLLAFLLMLQIPFPISSGRPGSTPLPDQSTIQGQVKTKDGEPIPLATISVQTRQDATRADQRGGGVGWPGAVTKVKRDGTFRVAVPGGSTYEVCADVPTKAKQCRIVDVSTNDVEVLVFEF